MHTVHDMVIRIMACGINRGLDIKRLFTVVRFRGAPDNQMGEVVGVAGLREFS